ncbi:hypothetical protein NDU88_006838 [Pleurodeles waltl]|uniref:Uncharacterized protein n=1 Tax=Pleurodeles waltl TaxID=8319 RepID=A0AAV7NRC4_PLEWA|nr:hypothetical protein NDU88_006838 [Pleurodeles waltl]
MARRGADHAAEGLRWPGDRTADRSGAGALRSWRLGREGRMERALHGPIQVRVPGDCIGCKKDGSSRDWTCRNSALRMGLRCEPCACKG